MENSDKNEEMENNSNISNLISNLQKRIEKIGITLDKSINLTLALQKEVGELKEDSLVNASHILLLKNSSRDRIKELNSNMNELSDVTNELVDGLEEEFKQNQTDNYTNFLKSLLEEDFKALQNEAIEQAKRELLNTKPSGVKKQENIIFSFFKMISPMLSIVSFILLLIICIKFKLFGVLFQ